MKYFIEYAGATITKVFSNGVPAYAVWHGPKRISEYFDTADEARKFAVEHMPKSTHKSYMGE